MERVTIEGERKIIEKVTKIIEKRPILSISVVGFLWEGLKIYFGF